MGTMCKCHLKVFWRKSEERWLKEGQRFWYRIIQKKKQKGHWSQVVLRSPFICYLLCNLSKSLRASIFSPLNKGKRMIIWGLNAWHSVGDQYMWSINGRFQPLPQSASIASKSFHAEWSNLHRSIRTVTFIKYLIYRRCSSWSFKSSVWFKSMRRVFLLHTPYKWVI